MPQSKRAHPGAPFLIANADWASALGELEGAASLLAAVFLALDHAGVAGKEAALLERAAQLGLEVGERARAAVAERTGLAGEAAARHGAIHVVGAGAVRCHERLLD